MAAQPALLSSPKGNSGACKVSQALTRTRWRCYHTSTGETWLDSCLDVQLWDGFTPGWHQRWPEHWPKDHTTGRNQGMGGSGAPLVASETRAKMAQVVSGKHWNRGAEGWGLGSSSVQQQGWGQLPCSCCSQSQLSSSHELAGAAHLLPAFLQADFLNQSIKNASMELVAINRKAPSSVGNTCNLPASLCCVGQPIALWGRLISLNTG